jgi:thymidylate synthase (FAD)
MKLNVEQANEIERARGLQEPTRRATVSALEEVLCQAMPLLDHGFVRVIDYMGDDAAIVQAARVSYGAGTKKVSDDRGLIRYLMRHHHSTPFEMCEIKLHVKLPIFVARQWVRHRTANINEYSARYSVLDNEFYVPDQSYLQTLKAEQKHEQKRNPDQTDMFAPSAPPQVQQLAKQSRSNKQGRDELLAPAEAAAVVDRIGRAGASAYRTYAKLLDEDGEGETRGIARELARIVLPTNIYTQWYWKTDLHNLFHFLKLRADPHAQYEIRVYAEAIAGIARRWVPLAYSAFEEYRLGAPQLSATGLAIIRRMLAGETVEQEKSGLSKREWRELMATLGRDAG